MRQDVRVLTADVPNTVTTYNAGDCVGGAVRLQGAVAEGGAVVKSVLVIDTDPNGLPLRLYLFDRPPAATNDAAFAPTAAEMKRLLGWVDVADTDYVAVGSYMAAQIDASLAVNADQAPDTAGQGPGDLWLVVVAPDGGSYDPGDSLRVRLGLIRA